MIARPFDAITNADIEALVTNAVAESRFLEYKQQLPGGTDDDKREFLADVSSFANAGGGDIIFGIVEQRDANGKTTGIPEKAEGLANVNADNEKRRIEEIIRNGIDPRIPGIRVSHHDGFSAGPILILRIPKSWVSPHMVTFKNLSRFFTRNSAGKYQLDVGEIRNAFTASGDVRTRMSEFRTERLSKILANESPIDLPATSKIILHLVPFGILDTSIQVDLTPVSQNPHPAAPIQPYSYDRRNNLDGYLVFNSNPNGGSIGYTQVFRSGALESVDAGLLDQSNFPKQIASTHVEQTILEATRRYLQVVKLIGTSLPLLLMVTLFGLKGYVLATGSARPAYGSPPIDRDILLLPDVLLENFETPPDVLLKPIFDAFWQSAGYAACQHYDANGHWVPTNS